MYRRSLVVNGVFLFAIALATRCAAGELVTDETIHQVFDKSKKAKDSHSVMTEQTSRLHEILDGYLTGNTVQIKKASKALSRDMRRVTSYLPSDTSEDSVVWNAMSEIVNQSNALYEEVEKGNLSKSYQHYTLLTAECVKCHQALREWGRFPAATSSSASEEPKAESSPALAPKKSGKSMK